MGGLKSSCGNDCRTVLIAGRSSDFIHCSSFSVSMASSAPRKVLIAMDGSKQADYALRYYKDNVHKAGDNLIVVFAGEHGKLTSQPISSTDPDFLARVANEEEGEVKKRLEKLKKSLDDADVQGTVIRHTASSPGEAVVMVAVEQRADLIVTGTRGLGTIRRTIMGSVSQYIVHHAHVPVLVCREK